MPRHVWAKVWCDLLRHRNFRKRPDCDKVLVVGLILHAKEHSEDGLIEGLDAEEMRGLFGIKAATAKVQEGLEYLLRIGWLQLVDDHGGLIIKDFIGRQANAKDSPDAVAERQRRWRERQKLRKTVTGAVTGEDNGSVTGGVTGKVTGSVTGQVPDPRPVTRNAEEEEEEDPRDDRSSKDGESEGKDTTACESVDNAEAIPANLSQSEQLHVSQLLKAGKASEAAALLAGVDKDPRRKAGGAT